ncbi:MAG: desulfoferrodoxin [Desulfovibrionaceae bacterium]|nr:desulfoferrodoxin [Desulfovibrionaceae bacterium]
MAELLDVYKCKHCGNVVSLLHVGQGALVCCGENMVKMQENTVDASQEKHVPVVEKTPDGFIVKVGSETHPSLPEHYIEWIEIISDNVSCLAFLKPGEEPKATFVSKADNVVAREYCNLHGLWAKR